MIAIIALLLLASHVGVAAVCWGLGTSAGRRAERAEAAAAAAREEAQRRAFEEASRGAISHDEVTPYVVETRRPRAP